MRKYYNNACCNIPRTIKKFLYYKDLWLLVKVLVTSLNITLSYLLGRVHLFLAWTFSQRLKSTKSQDKEKIVRYVNLCLFLRKRLGMKDTCLTHSLLLCHMLRQAGFDAKINFGVKKKKGNLIGHCWLDNDKNERSDYQLIFSYP